MIINKINDNKVKITIHIPDEIDNRNKVEKINQIYDILKPKKSVRESA